MKLLRAFFFNSFSGKKLILNQIYSQLCNIKLRKTLKMPTKTGKDLKIQNQIPHESRVKLIKLVLNESYSIKAASVQVKINYSTAKLIMRKYLAEGTITKFFYERQQEQNKEEMHQKTQFSKEMLQSENIQQKFPLQQNQIQQKISENSQSSINYFQNMLIWNSYMCCQLNLNNWLFMNQNNFASQQHY